MRLYDRTMVLYIYNIVELRSFIRPKTCFSKNEKALHTHIIPVTLLFGKYRKYVLKFFIKINNLSPNFCQDGIILSHNNSQIFLSDNIFK